MRLSQEELNARLLAAAKDGNKETFDALVADANGANAYIAAQHIAKELDLNCPITYCIMRDPVTAQDGKA